MSDEKKNILKWLRDREMNPFCGPHDHNDVASFIEQQYFPETQEITDTMRLDFVEKNRLTLTPFGCGWVLTRDGLIVTQRTYCTPREAINAAMKESGK